VTKKSESMMFFYRGMERLGFTLDEADKLRRIESTLHRWAERECNGEIERDEETGIAYSASEGKRLCQRTDLETWALKRLAAILESHPDLISYHQTDPRGCALYIIRRADLLPDVDLDAQYSRGFAVCY